MPFPLGAGLFEPVDSIFLLLSHREPDDDHTADWHPGTTLGSSDILGPTICLITTGSVFVPWTTHPPSSIISPTHILSGNIFSCFERVSYLDQIFQWLEYPTKCWSLQRCWRQVQSFKFRACKDEVVDSSVRLKYLSTPALSSPNIHAFISNFFFFLQKMALDKIGFKGIAAISRNAFSDQTLLPNSQLPLSNIETHFKDLSVS